MDVLIKKWKDGTISNDEFENEWYRMMHCKPNKKTEKRTFQTSWSTHPISKDLPTLRNAAPTHKKRAITQCIKYGKMWWTKSTDTYLFPAYAAAIFLNNFNHDTDKPVIIQVGKKQAMDIYRLMEKNAGPDDFVRKIVASDQHTTMGALNGVGKKSPYANCTFSLYHSAVRPYTRGCEWVYRDYIEFRLGHMEKKWKQKAYDNLKAFGEGTTSHSQFWDETCLVMKHGLGLMEPTPPTYWKEPKEPTRKSLAIHPNPEAAFHFRCSPLRDGWPLDSLVSGLQKMIRRSCMFDACWCACRLLMFALFHLETRMGTATMWSIFPGAQAKITNMINRLIIITAEDLYPDAKLFVDVTSVLEMARKSLLDLKEPQTEQLYHKRFEMLTQSILSVIVSLVSRPKQHYIGSRLFKFREHYVKAGESLSAKEEEENKKRKQADIRTLFNF